MKVIFLDIDGVLNSFAYDRIRTENDSNIDKTRLELVKELVDATGAKIVLSSSWRKHWYRNATNLDEHGRDVQSSFSSVGLEIYDKTPEIGYLQRGNEIRLWIADNPEVESFVILDDIGFGWDDLSENLVKTDPRIGRGLERSHIDRAAEILGKI